MDEYNLEVLAVDSGTPPQTGTVLVNIKVTDANDNAPRFAKANYTAIVQVNCRHI